jgi:DNA-directed RNA polymerase specialized sigma24 family protein
VAEDLADETIDRVTSRVGALAASYQGDPALYFYAAAQNIYVDYLRRRSSRSLAPASTSVGLEDERPEHECLEECLNGLTARARSVILLYYRHEKHTRADLRRKLALQLGISDRALRIRAHRIRAILAECVARCVERQNGS